MSSNKFAFANTESYEWVSECKVREIYPDAYKAMDNSLFKIDQMVYNKKTQRTGPIQRVAYSGTKVLYYHCNNPCVDEDLVALVNRRRL